MKITIKEDVVMKKVLLGLFLLSFLVPHAKAAESGGPELKFDPNTVSAGAESKPAKDFVYGAQPIAKFGNDQNYIKLGGYGSMRFEADTGQDLNDTFTLRRLVFETDARIASRFRIYSELEFERFRKIELERNVVATPGGGLSVSQDIEGTTNSEISLEQAWFELTFRNWIKLRGGAVLVPLGRFNINHDDNLWNLPRRSLVDRGVPVLASTAAWDELGMGLNGDIEIGEKQKVNYQIYVVNGAILDATVEQNIQTRVGDTTLNETEAEFDISTGAFAHDVKNAKTVTGRVMYSPALGHEFGFSGYWGRYTPSYLPSENLTSFGFDTLHTWKNFDLEAEYIFTHFGGLRNVVNGLAAQIIDQESEGEDDSTSPGVENEVAFTPSAFASTKQGYWVELRYHLRPQFLTKSFFGKYFSDPQFIPILRWEQAFLSDRLVEATYSNGAVNSYVTQNRRVDRITAGMAFRLNPLAVFHLAYEYTQTNKGQALADVTNYLPTPSSRNSAVMFGAAFGF